MEHEHTQRDAMALLRELVPWVESLCEMMDTVPPGLAQALGAAQELVDPTPIEGD